MEKLGPKKPDDETMGKPCEACGKPFAEGDFTTFVVLGPGDDATQQLRCRMGYTYTGVAVELHWACATGERP
jgi:hypothetical protein